MSPNRRKLHIRYSRRRVMFKLIQLKYSSRLKTTLNHFLTGLKTKMICLISVEPIILEMSNIDESPTLIQQTLGKEE